MSVDQTKPNVGRIYDYLLGGQHNFEADRAVAARIIQTLPSAPKWARMNRWFLHYALDELASAGLNRFIDLATGLPTQGYIHEWGIEDALVVYNDIDASIVAYARELIGANPSVRYTQADLRNVSEILGEAESLFGGPSRCGICMVGVVYLVDDESLSAVLERLHDWAKPGSLLALSCFDRGVGEGVIDIYRGMGTTLYPRTREKLLELVGGWQLQEPGLRPLREHVEQHMQMRIDPADLDGLDFFYGGLFKKP